MMKRIVLCLLFSLLAFSAKAQEVNTQPEPQAITIGERFSLASQILGERRSGLLAVGSDAKRPNSPSQTSPTPLARPCT